jgi:hypothetical protein
MPEANKSIRLTGVVARLRSVIKVARTE